MGIKKKNFWSILLVLLAMDFGSLRAQNTAGETVVRLDSALDAFVASDAKVEKILDRVESPTTFEGPTWVGAGHSGYLLFTDPHGDAIDKLMPDGTATVFLDHIFTGKPSEMHGPGPGPNGMTLDREGRVVYAASSNGQIVRLEKDGTRTVLADRFDGRRFNLVNDIVFKSDDSAYFTDSRQSYKYEDGDGIPNNGLYLVKAGKVQLLTKDISHPNGLAFSPDEKYLYANDTDLKTIERFDVRQDGTIANGNLFADMSSDKAEGAPDGMKVDKNGNVYCTGPGGVWIISAGGKHIGTILTPKRITNFTFGDDDAKTLYLTAAGVLYRIRLLAPGIRP